MDIGINSFVANITEGFASPNKYKVMFNRPNITSNSRTGTSAEGSGDDESISIMCNVANIPGRSIKTYENRHYGVPFKLPYTAEYGDISFSFVSQIGFREREFFKKWQEEVVDPVTGLLNFYDNYKGSIILFHLDGRDGDPDYMVNIIDAYPVSVGEMALGYSMMNETMISSITFTYRSWNSNTIKR